MAENLIHDWFGLSYSNYLIMPRSILQSMPMDWQKRLIALYEEYESKMLEEKMQFTPDYCIFPQKQLEKLSDITVGELLEDYDSDDEYAPYYVNNQRCQGLRNVFNEEDLKN